MIKCIGDETVDVTIFSIVVKYRRHRKIYLGILSKSSMVLFLMPSPTHHMDFAPSHSLVWCTHSICQEFVWVLFILIFFLLCILHVCENKLFQFLYVLSEERNIINQVCISAFGKNYYYITCLQNQSVHTVIHMFSCLHHFMQHIHWNNSPIKFPQCTYYVIHQYSLLPVALTRLVMTASYCIPL